MSEPRHLEPVPLGRRRPPYSKGLMARALIAIGVPLGARMSWPGGRPADSTRAARVDLDRMHELAVEILGEKEGGRPCAGCSATASCRSSTSRSILLVGGATGTGKSTIATEVAYRLGIRRVTSTDFVRQTMRAFFSREFMPSIHYSSFEAGRAVCASRSRRSDPVIAGFLEQTRNVLVGVQAAIDRALEEGWSMVLEGVHLVPGHAPARRARGGRQCVLNIDDQSTHAQHFVVRDAASTVSRRMDKYLSAFDDIRQIQDLIVRRARRSTSAVIANENMDRPSPT